MPAMARTMRYSQSIAEVLEPPAGEHRRERGAAVSARRTSSQRRTQAEIATVRQSHPILIGPLRERFRGPDPDRPPEIRRFRARARPPRRRPPRRPARRRRLGDLGGSRAAQLEDLERDHQIDAGGERDDQAGDHHRRPRRVEVAVVVGVGDEAQRQREPGHHQRPAVEVGERPPLREADVRHPVVEVPAVGRGRSAGGTGSAWRSRSPCRGSARRGRSSGKNRATTAFVFSAPCTAIAPSR